MKTRISIWTAAVLVAGAMFLGMQIKELLSADDVYVQTGKFKDVLSLAEKYYVDGVDTRALTEAAITAVLNSLDPHSVYIPAKAFEHVTEDFQGKFEGIGIEFRVLNDTILVLQTIGGGPSATVGILANDRIVAIDGKPALRFSDDDVRNHLRGRKGTRVTVTIVRSGTPAPLVFEITRDEIPLVSVDAAIMVGEGIGYLRVNRFNEQTGREVSQGLGTLKRAGMKKLVLDLRFNPGGFLEEAVRMADLFLDGGTGEKPKSIVSTKGRKPEFNETYVARTGDEFESLPIIVLLSNGSASASEIVAGALQDWDRAIIVGETSFGKGLVQRQWGLADGSAVRLTISKYYTPSGRLIQRPFAGKDRTEYQHEAFRRNEEEGENMEHHRDGPEDPDSLRPVFTTHAGRSVFGGGGITPDYIVRDDTLTSFTAGLRRRDVFVAFAASYLDGAGMKLRQRFGKDFESYRVAFHVDDRLLADFRKFIEDRGVTVDDKALGADRVFVRANLKGSIARGIWGTEAVFPIYLEIDRQFQKALSLFPEAERLAGLRE